MLLQNRCFDDIDHNKQRQQNVCDHDVCQLSVYLQTSLPGHLNCYVEFNLSIGIGLKKQCLRYSFYPSVIF